MLSCQWCVYTLLALYLSFSSTNATLQHRKPIIYWTIFVNPSGKGDFRTIQAAIDSVPSDNKRWTCIHIKKGVYRWRNWTCFNDIDFCAVKISLSCIFTFLVYLHSCREQVRIPYNKPFIYLKGEGKRKTYVVWDAHDSTATSATFTSHADNTIAKCITFVVRSWNVQGPVW